jgi:hypothetical protein
MSSCKHERHQKVPGTLHNHKCLDCGEILTSRQLGISPRQLGQNKRAVGSDPRTEGTNPRKAGTNPCYGVTGTGRRLLQKARQKKRTSGRGKGLAVHRSEP